MLADEAAVQEPGTGSAAHRAGPGRGRRLAALRAALGAERLLPPLFLAGVLAAFSVGFFWTALTDVTRTFPGGPGDPEQFQFFLAWPVFALGHGLDPLVTHYVLYPGGTNLMWNTSVVFPGLVLAPVTLLWGPTATYDVLLAAAPVANALAGYLAFRRWSRPWPAALGGLLFGLSPFVFAQAQGHLHLVLVALVPLALLLLDEILVRQRPPSWLAGAALGALAAAQLLTAEEILAFMALLGLIGVGLLAALHPRAVRDHAGYALRAGGAAAVSFLVLAGYPLYVQFAGPYRVTAPIHDPTYYVNDLLNVVLPVNELIGGRGAARVAAHWSSNASEWNAYLGLPLLIMIAVVGWRCRRLPVVRLALPLLVLAELFSFGFQLHVDGDYTGIPMPWRLFDGTPVLQQAVASRWSLFADLFGALLVALFADRVLPVVRRHWRPSGAVIAAMAVITWLPAPLASTTVAQPSYLEPGGPVSHLRQGSVALLLPLVDSPASEHPQLWLARAGFPVKVPEGYVIVPGSHAGPPTYTQVVWNAVSRGQHPSRQAMAWMMEELAAWGVDTIIVGPWPGQQQQAVAILAQLLPDHAPQWYGDTAVFEHLSLG